MNRPEVIEKLKNQCENLDISKSLLKDIFTHGYNWEWLLEESNKEHKKFGKILKNLKFKFVHQDGGGEKGAEHCESVIELEGQLFMLSYSYYSYSGYNIYDYWNWRPVKAVQKTVTFYE